MTVTNQTVQSNNPAAVEYGVEDFEVEQDYWDQPEQATTPTTLDLAIAQEYITALTGSPDTRVTFQTFDDDDDRKLPSLCRQWADTTAPSQVELERLSKAGAGLFVTVQQTDGTGRKAENITKVRALFVDFDGHLPTGSEWHLQPSMIVRSSGDKGHAYWLLSESIAPNKEEFRKLQQQLIAHYSSFGSDPSCCDLARVLRLPGSYHLKKEPTLVTNGYIGSERYTVDEVMAGIAEHVEDAKTKVPKDKAPSKVKATHSSPLPENKGFDSELADAVAKVASCTQNRNCNLNTVAYTIAGQFPDRLDEIQAALTEAAIACGLEPHEILSTLKSATVAGSLKPITAYGSDQLIKLGQTDTGKLLAAEVLTNHKFDTEASQWWEYDGKGKWNPVKEARIFKLAHDYLDGKVYITSDTYLNSSIRFAKTAVQVDGWSEMSSLQYLPFSNFVLDIAANQCLPHSPDYGFTWQLPRAYSPALADWTSIDRFLDTLANNDPELKMLAIAFCNAVLKGRSDLQKFLYLFGSGANGKGAFMTLLQMLIGSENIHSSNMSELNGNRFESANLKGKRLLLMTDEDKRSGGVGVFKAATGGDPIRFEQKGKDASHFTFKGVVVVAANNPTFVGCSDGGIKRRKVDFPCLAHIKEMDRVNMSPLFDADLTAFTTYLLSLDDAWVTETIRKASNLEAVKELSRELAKREDSVAAFADEFEVTSSAGGEVRGVYAVYVKFCGLNGLKPKSAVNFMPSLLDYCKGEGFEVSNLRDKKGKYLQGLGVVIPEIYREIQ
jgi:P4 family phage/plasmid primase-like protien